MDTQNLLGDETTPTVPPNSDERTMAILSHILTIFFGFIPPLVIFLIKKDESTFIADHSKEALNFQITVTILYIILLVTIIGILFWWVVYIINIVFSILATIKASESKLYRYPINFRIIK